MPYHLAISPYIYIYTCFISISNSISNNFIITIAYLYIRMKLKTKKAVAKRIKNKNPIFIKKKANKAHLLRKKNSSQLRRLSECSFINMSDIRIIKLMLPYIKKKR